MGHYATIVVAADRLQGETRKAHDSSNSYK